MKKIGPTQPLIWLTIAFIVFIWGSAISDPTIRALPQAVPFTLLMVASGVLHWRIESITTHRRAVAYVAAQLALGAGGMLIARGVPVALTLYAPLVGEIFGFETTALVKGGLLTALIAVWAGVLAALGHTDIVRFVAPGLLIGVGFIGIFVTLFARQIRERERAESLLAQLGEAHTRLKDYALQVEELTVAEERQRLARELHDTLAQGLAGLVMQLEAIDDLLGRGDAGRARTVTERALERARGALSEARVAIQALRTPLERGSILQSIAVLVDEFRADTGIECTFEIGGVDQTMPGGTSIQLQRIVREALTNVARHSQARHVAVRLDGGSDSVIAEVIDDGCGFDPGAVPPGHFGLVGLRERVRLAGGDLVIDARPGAGTRLSATLPLIPQGGATHE